MEPRGVGAPFPTCACTPTRASRLVPLVLLALNLHITIAFLEHEVLRWTYGRTALPQPTSDLTATYTLAPNDEGDLAMAIYLLGGCVAAYIPKPSSPKEYCCPSVTNMVWSYDPTLDLFSKRRAMPVGRHRHSASAVGGKIWVLGGRDESDEVVSEVDVYDPAFDTWTNFGNLPPDLAVSDHASFVHREDLFIAGGYNSDYLASDVTFVIDTAQTLNTGALVFQTRARLKVARGDVKAVTYARFAYVVGGFTHTDRYCQPLGSMEVYDTRADVWINATEGGLNVGRADISLMKYNGHFIALGGETRLDGDEECLRNGGINTTPGSLQPTKPLLPRRMTRPVSSVEVYNPLEGSVGRWYVIEGGLPDGDETFRFVTAPWPDNASIYAFGGVKPYSDGKVAEKGGCTDCMEPSDVLIVYSDVMEPDKTRVLQIVGWAFFALFLASRLVVTVKKKSRRMSELSQMDHEMTPIT